MSGGRFLGLGSALVSLPIALTVMGPYGASADPARPWAPFAASLVSWGVLAAALIAPAIAERRVAGRATRAAVVVGTVVVASALRPILMDVLLLPFGAHPDAAHLLPFRIATNVVVWGGVLSAAAMAEDAVRSTRRATTRLGELLAQTDAALRSQHAADLRGRLLLERCVADLGARTVDLSTTEDVLRFSDGPVRSWSRRLADEAEEHPRPEPATHPKPPAPPASRATLRIPPPGLSWGLYVLALLPYALRTLDGPQLLWGAVLTACGGLCADLLPRRMRGARMPARVLTFVALTVIVGLLLSMFALLVCGESPWAAAVPSVSFVAAGLTAAWCTGLAHRLRSEERRVTAAVRERRRALVVSGARARRMLREAGQVLHRDLQGMCVVTASSPQAGPAAIAQLRDDIRRLVEGLPATSSRQRDADAESIRTLLRTWGRALTVRDRIAPEAVAALDDDPDAAAEVFEIVAEGLINAVKHADAHTARVDVVIVPTGRGRVVHVVVAAPGVIAPGIGLRPGSRMASLGAHLAQRDGDVALSARVPLAGDRSGPVVSAEHPGRVAHSGR